jgi:hypothetical protein
MDPVQLTIVIISFALAVLLIVLGVQVFYILKEIRGSMQRMNKMLDDAGKISGTVSEGFVSMSGLMSGLRAGLTFVKTLRGKSQEEEEDDE